MISVLEDIAIVILSCIAIIYSMIYSIALIRIKKAFSDEKIQKDSNISLLFYIGIAIFSLNEIIQVITNSFEVNSQWVYQGLQVITLILFVVALSMRLKTSKERYEIYKTKGNLNPNETLEKEPQKESNVKFKRKPKL